MKTYKMFLLCFLFSTVFSFVLLSSETSQAALIDLTTLKLSATDGSTAGQDLKNTLNDAVSITQALQTDKLFAANVLAAVQKRNTAALATLLQAKALQSTVTVTSVDPDFRLQLTIFGRGPTRPGLIFCIAGGKAPSKCPNGGNFQLSQP